MTRTWPHDAPETRGDTVGKVDFVRPDGVRSFVGGQRIAFDRNTGRDVYAFRYPMLPCDMRAGSSGGPWLADFDPLTRIGTLIGLQSADGDHSGVGPVGVSPILGPLTEQIYERAQTL
ncbi:hypothetical protein [Streptomyces sp. NPDC059009]|uniref:hypothetical protein n=1 Tax=Streptomyces sp. NPDC059009 TaxID=3346694 RepID=UPI0036B84E36